MISQPITTRVAPRSGRQDADRRRSRPLTRVATLAIDDVPLSQAAGRAEHRPEPVPDVPAVPEEVARLIDLAGHRFRRAGLLSRPWTGPAELLTEMERLLETPLNGALSEPDRNLCRMALREAGLRLTAWPRRQRIAGLLEATYAWLGETHA